MPLIPCPACAAMPGTLHARGCDVECCPRCGRQVISCSCERRSHERRLPWTGEWPGVRACRALGWYARLRPGRGWVPCASTDPGAVEDLNRLLVSGRWDPEIGAWRLDP